MKDYQQLSNENKQILNKTFKNTIFFIIIFDVIFFLLNFIYIIIIEPKIFYRIITPFIRIIFLIIFILKNNKKRINIISLNVHGGIIGRNLSTYPLLGIWYYIGLLDIFIIRIPYFLFDIVLIFRDSNIIFVLIKIILIDLLWIFKWKYSVYKIYTKGVIENLNTNVLLY